MFKSLFRGSAAFLIIISPALAADDLRVLPDKLEGGIPPSEMMQEFLLGGIEQQWKLLTDGYEALIAPQGIEDYQKRMRDQFLRMLGPFPERTPLNPQITGTIRRDGYHVEKVLFESRPHFHVSAALFLPEPSRHAPPYPGVIVPCGHAENAKAHKPYQSMGALLALNGIAALVFDPVDQGERMQLLDSNGKRLMWGTCAHNLLGAPSILLGHCTATFEVWDGMRAIDYLQSRPEVDPDRIGCTGNSGGGTQTAYLMALDERIRAAAPSCYIHHQSVQLRKAVGDAEQNLFGQMLSGPDHPDFIMMRAPSPVLLCAATKDFFDINATWETFRYAKRLYTGMGLPERVSILENNEKHNFDKIPREGVARWMSRWLLGKDVAIVEPDLQLIDDNDLWATPKGQVMLLQGERSAYDVNAEEADALAQIRHTAWTAGGRTKLLHEIRRLVGVRPLAELLKQEPQAVGEATHGDCALKKLVFTPDPGVVLPALFFRPAASKTGEAVLLVNEEGKAEACRDEGPVDDGLKQEFPVLAIDLRGTGETEPESQEQGYDGSGGDWKDFFRAYALGRSYVGMRAEDILVCAAYLRGQGLAVHLLALGNAGVPALHAAALEPDLFSSVRLSGTLASWDDAVRRKPAKHQLINSVQGALRVYDLPDLAALVGTKLTIESPVDGQGNPLQ